MPLFALMLFIAIPAALFFTPLAAFLLLFVYLAPTYIAWRAKVPKTRIFLVNFFLGWTIIGWIVAMQMVFREKAKTPEWEMVKERINALNDRHGGSVFFQLLRSIVNKS